MGQLKKALQMIKGANNPQAMLQQMMTNNRPEMQKAMEYVKQHGNDPKAACEALAKEQGFDLDEIMKGLL